MLDGFAVVARRQTIHQSVTSHNYESKALQTHHPDGYERLVAVIEQVLGLSGVDAADTKQQLARQPECHRLGLLLHDVLWMERMAREQGGQLG